MVGICVIAISLSYFVYTVSQNAVKVTFISNEGFLIEAGQSKILIDALHHLAPEFARNRMRRAASPFDGIELVLSTHDHHDHFDPELAAALLANDFPVTFVGNKRTVLRITSYYEGKDDIRKRLKVFQPEEGEKLNLNT